MSLTVYKDVEVKIASYINTYWTYTQVQFPNQQFDPDNLVSWAQMFVSPISRKRLCLTGSSGTGQLTKGILVFNLYTKQNTGTGDIKDLVTHAVDLFNYAEIATDAGETIHFWESRAEPGRIDGNWWRETVKTDFQVLI